MSRPNRSLILAGVDRLGGVLLAPLFASRHLEESDLQPVLRTLAGAAVAGLCVGLFAGWFRGFDGIYLLREAAFTGALFAVALGFFSWVDGEADRLLQRADD